MAKEACRNHISLAPYLRPFIKFSLYPIPGHFSSRFSGGFSERLSLTRRRLCVPTSQPSVRSAVKSTVPRRCNTSKTLSAHTHLNLERNIHVSLSRRNMWTENVTVFVRSRNGKLTPLGELLQKDVRCLLETVREQSMSLESIEDDFA